LGEFVDLLTELAGTRQFKQVVSLPAARMLDGSPQDYVLRFFAFHERYMQFEHSVNDFLNDFCRDAAADPRIEERATRFRQTFRFLADVFPEGIKNRSGVTPVNLYEGASVGAALALEVSGGNLTIPVSTDWITSEELRRYTTGATNDRSRVSGRIEFCRDKFLEGQ
jgi:hypothetical protein